HVRTHSPAQKPIATVRAGLERRPPHTQSQSLELRRECRTHPRINPDNRRHLLSPQVWSAYLYYAASRLLCVSMQQCWLLDQNSHSADALTLLENGRVACRPAASTKPEPVPLRCVIVPPLPVRNQYRAVGQTRRQST